MTAPPGSAASGPRRTDVVVLVALLAVAAAVRVPGLFSRAIWYDETITLLETAAGDEVPFAEGPTPAGTLKGAFEGSRSLNGITGVLVTTDIHPPLYYWLLSRWRAGLGSSLEIARLLSLLCSLGAVAALYVLLRLARVSWPAIPVLLFALSTDAVHYGHEARGYALASLLVMVGATLALHASIRPTSAPTRLAVMIVCLAAACLTEYVALFPVGAVLTWFAARTFKVSWRRALGVPAAAALLFAAAHRALGLQAQAGMLGTRSREEGGYVGLVGEIKGILKSATATFAQARSEGGRDVIFLVLLALVVLTLVVWLRDRPAGDPSGIVPLFAGLSAAPLIGMLVIDTVFGMHVYRNPRYVMLAAPGLAVLASYGATRLRGRPRLVGLAALALIGGVQLAAVNWGEERCRGMGRGGPFYRSVARDVSGRSSSPAVAVLGVGFGRGDPWSFVYEMAPGVPCVFLHEGSDTSALAGELSGFGDVWILGASDGQTAEAERRLAAELLGRGRHREVPYVYGGAPSSRYRHLVASPESG